MRDWSPIPLLLVYEWFTLVIELVGYLAGRRRKPDYRMLLYTRRGGGAYSGRHQLQKQGRGYLTISIPPLNSMLAHAYPNTPPSKGEGSDFF